MTTAKVDHDENFNMGGIRGQQGEFEGTRGNDQQGRG
jgi:hypothetical protein